MEKQEKDKNETELPELVESAERHPVEIVPPVEPVLPAENLTRINTHTLRAKGEPRPNPSDFSISLRAKFGTDQQLLLPGERQQSMRGFEDHYTDIIDFIVRATHRIWEEKDVGYIYEHYRHNIRVMDDYGLQIGRDKVIANTIQFLNAFPDIRLIADEIIWAGNDEVGFHTSHRTFITGTNTGYSQFGPPTGRKVHFWLIANCIFVANENYEEWVIYNNASMIQQMGFNLRDKAREMGSSVDWDSLNDQRFGEPDRLPGQGKPPHLLPRQNGGFDIEDFIRRLYHYIWNWRLISRVRDAYAPNMRFFGPSDRAFYGRGNYQSFVLSILAMFPDLALYIDDLYWMGNDEEGYVTSVRWSIVGTHTGQGVYGPPTNRPVYMWGITQHHIKDGKIEEEWMMYNEFEVMQQIYRE
jgi:hypothetical protein